MLKSPEQFVMHTLVATAATARHLGTRVFPLLSPSSAQLPFAVYRRQSISRQHTLRGAVGVPLVTLEVSIFAATYHDVRIIADTVRETLDGRGGVFHNTEVANITLEQESDDFVTLAGSELPPMYQITQTYGILWKEI
jgi:hypothetical protein